jgi:hypothetical protein
VVLKDTTGQYEANELIDERNTAAAMGQVKSVASPSNEAMVVSKLVPKAVIYSLT